MVSTGLLCNGIAAATEWWVLPSPGATAALLHSDRRTDRMVRRPTVLSREIRIKIRVRMHSRMQHEYESESESRVYTSELIENGLHQKTSET